MSWDERACKGKPTDLFFPGRGETRKVREAKAICSGCPADQLCLTFALKHEDPSARFGIYGGLTADERGLLYGRV